MRMLTAQPRARIILALVLTVVCCIAWAPVSFAQSDETTSATTPSAPEETSSADDGKAMLILDASSSMLEEDANGPRIDAAKQAATDLVHSLPETANMGLMVYGANESDAPDNRDAGCRDIDTLVPVGKVDKDRFTSAIEKVTPKGYTPMGNSLRAAADELGDEGTRSIILVSDGIDSCAPPPVCEVAKELAEQGVDLAIHTVGFKVDDAAREELQCIAKEGNGEFLEADDVGSLTESLKFLAQRDVGKYQLKGTKFEFADNPNDAKWLGEGQYQTKVKPDTNAKQDRYFRVSVPEEHNAHITLTPVWQTNGNVHHANVFIETATETNEVDHSCGTADTSLGNRSIFGNAQFGIEPYEIVLRRDGKDDDCDMSSWLISTQVYQDGDEITDDVNLEVNVFYEPIPEDEQAKKWKDQKLSSPAKYDGDLAIDNAETITGGTGFNDAVEVSEGSYSDKIVPGEFRFYKIPVAWGQRPVVRAKTPESEVSEHDMIGFGLHNPFRGDEGDGSLSVIGNKSDESEPVAPHDFAWFAPKSPRQGFYYLWFGMGSKGEGETIGVEQPYEFAVMLDGEPAEGGPDWEPTYENGPEPSDEPIKFDSVADDSSEGKDTERQEMAKDEDDSARPAWLIPALAGGGVLLLVLLGLLGFLVARNKRR